MSKSEHLVQRRNLLEYQAVAKDRIKNDKMLFRPIKHPFIGKNKINHNYKNGHLQIRVRSASDVWSQELNFDKTTDTLGSNYRDALPKQSVEYLQKRRD